MKEYYKEQLQPDLALHGIEFFLKSKEGQGILARAHTHSAIEILYVTKSVFEVDVNNDHFTAREGDMILSRANAVHTTWHKGKGVGEYFTLKISPSLLFHFFSEEHSNAYIVPFIRRETANVSFFPAATLSEETKRIFAAMIRECERPDEFSFPIERSLSAALLISLLRSVIEPSASMASDATISEKSVELVHEAITYINENYRWSITAAACAASVHLSYSYFAKIFRAVTGKTFKEYLTGVRLAKAHASLVSTALPVSDVAAACGYDSLSYFISEYKRVYGETPRETKRTLSSS